MTPKKQADHGYDAPEQSEEAREAALSTVASTANTATGNAARELRGEAAEIPSGAERGSQIPIAGGEPSADAVAEGAPPTGAQKQAAAFSSNGALEPNMVGSPSGPIPAHLAHADPAAQKKAVEEAVNSSKRLAGHSDGPAPLSRAQIEAASGAILRAAAFDRGYDLGPQRGNRGTRAAFIKAQREALGEDSTEETSSETTES